MQAVVYAPGRASGFVPAQRRSGIYGNDVLKGGNVGGVFWGALSKGAVRSNNLAYRIEERISVYPSHTHSCFKPVARYAALNLKQLEAFYHLIKGFYSIIRPIPISNTSLRLCVAGLGSSGWPSEPVSLPNVIVSLSSFGFSISVSPHSYRVPNETVKY